MTFSVFIASDWRIRLEDVSDHKKRQMTASYAAMEELQEQADDLKMEF